MGHVAAPFKHRLLLLRTFLLPSGNSPGKWSSPFTTTSRPQRNYAPRKVRSASFTFFVAVAGLDKALLFGFHDEQIQHFFKKRSGSTASTLSCKIFSCLAPVA